TLTPSHLPPLKPSTSPSETTSERNLIFIFGFSSGFRLVVGSPFGYLSATAWALAPRMDARKGWAVAGAGTLPISKALVVTFGPYIAWRESLSWRIDAPSSVSPANTPLARE